MGNIDSYINVKFYYLLNETTPGFVAIQETFWATAGFESIGESVTLSDAPL